MTLSSRFRLRSITFNSRSDALSRSSSVGRLARDRCVIRRSMDRTVAGAGFCFGADQSPQASGPHHETAWSRPGDPVIGCDRYQVLFAAHDECGDAGAPGPCHRFCQQMIGAVGTGGREEVSTLE